MPLEAGSGRPVFLDTGPALLTAGGASHSFISGPQEGGRLTFEADGDITLMAPDGHDTFVQGVSVYELEQTVLVQADRIGVLEGGMMEMMDQLAELKLATYKIQQERKVEKTAEEAAPHGLLAGLFPRARRKTNG